MEEGSSQFYENLSFLYDAMICRNLFISREKSRQSTIGAMQQTFSLERTIEELLNK